MIENIYVKDFAIFKEVNLSFHSGLTAITGETGSGKSILIQALLASIGNKVSKEMVRGSSEKAIIDTEIKNDYFRRIILKSGKSRCFFNEDPISIKKIKEINKTNIDFHGQNDQQLIFEVASHINYLDRFCKLEKKIKKISNIFQRLETLNYKLNKIKSERKIKNEKLELLTFQISEIDAVKPKIGEDLKLEIEYKKNINAQNIITTLNDVENNISNYEDSIINKLNTISRHIESLIKFDPSFKDMCELIKNYTVQLQELSYDVNIKLDNTETDPENLIKVENRLQSIETLKRKYGGSLELVIKKREELNNEIKTLKELTISENKVVNEIKQKRDEFSLLAIEIHKIRVSKIKSLENKVEMALKNLNMPNSKFKIKIDQNDSETGIVKFNNRKLDANIKGVDRVEFFISANPGEPVKPLTKIISGGEASRMMLALKKVFQQTDPVNTLVFDEIDSGISGETANKVAKELADISKFKQVICITHLPQIAQKADHHLHITKTINKKNTSIKMKYLNKIQSNRVLEDLFFSSKKENI